MCKSTKIILFVALCLCGTASVRAQTNFEGHETHLKRLFDSLTQGHNQHVRHHANTLFIRDLDSIIRIPGAISYPFERIAIPLLISSNQCLRIFSWMVPNDDRTIEYFGLIVYAEKKHPVQCTRLIDQSQTLFDPSKQILKPKNWFGAFYTQMIETKDNNQTYYTLLGWNGANLAVNRKVIDVLVRKSNGSFQLGADIFRMGKERIRRKIFEYSRKASMILRYDTQHYVEVLRPAVKPNYGEKGKPAKEKLIRSPMIVYDRLVPSLTDLNGSYQNYVPGGGVYDALVWIDHRWTLKLDIRANNPSSKSRPHR